MTGPSFTFRLERVRALRERTEDMAKEELAASMHQRVQGQSLLAAAEARLEDARSTRRFSTSVPASGTELLAAQAYLERIERLRQAAELDLDRHDAEVDARRVALEQAARERQVLERLKSRRRAEHDAEAARLEGATLDELALSVHRRAEAAR